MKKYMFILLLMSLVNGLNAQVGSQELYDEFPALPSSMTNNDLKAIISPSTLLNDKLSAQLASSFIPGGMNEYFVIGKYSVGKTIHLLYGAVNWYDKSKNDYAMNVACSSFNSKSGEMVLGGLKNYLCMVGQDALTRESSFSVSGDLITFIMKSTDKQGNVETETTQYKFSKFLEFVSRN
jgi:hypothetical protein